MKNSLYKLNSVFSKQYSEASENKNRKRQARNGGRAVKQQADGQPESLVVHC